MALLSRVADRIYWAARYMERAEDTSRVVSAFGDVFVEMPTIDSGEQSLWAPLATLVGGATIDSSLDEAAVVRALVVDHNQPCSVAASVGHARSNLRTTREVLPREAWQAVNDLWMFVERDVDRAVDRRFRHRILSKVIDDSRRLEGILMSTMTRDAAYDMWRLGRLMERADMTTRVVGVRAAALMTSDDHTQDEVHWMGVLRSLSALQMYQRAVRGPVEGRDVVRFLLFHDRFPRSVAFTLGEMKVSLGRLTRSDDVGAAVTEAERVLRSTPAVVDDGRFLDQAMEEVQVALQAVSAAIDQRYLRVGDT